VDTKKKELIGNFKNTGAEYGQTRKPAAVLGHDFPIKELGKVAPYGIYDIKRNEGFVNLGISHDTAEFAVESIVRWWQTLGRNTYPDASKLYKQRQWGQQRVRGQTLEETITGAGEHNGLGGTCLPFPPWHIEME
jgi:hypothetical protein